jgi:pyruvate/2-oxoglutarate dehydrogenase complex dihydrolipoamide acyltransferase (E2) component
MNPQPESYRVLPVDRWMSAMAGFVGEVARMDTVTFTSLVDASALAEAREQVRHGVKPTYTALVIKAISLALREHPALNRLLLGGLYRFRPVQLHPVDAVVAVERDQGDTVFATIVRDTDRKPVEDITAELRHMATCADEDEPRLRLFRRLVRWVPGWLCRWLFAMPRWSPAMWRQHRGGSFALTTVGKYGVDAIQAKWPWPLTFTFGEVAKRPMVVDDEVVPRLSFYLTMSWHRQLCNGAPAARFFQRVCQILEEADASLSESTLAGAVPETVQV